MSDFHVTRSVEGATATPVHEHSGGLFNPAQAEEIMAAQQRKASVESMREGFAAQTRSPTQVGRELAPGVVVSANDTREITDQTRVRVDGQTEVTVGDLRAYAPGRLGSFMTAGRRA